MIQSQILFLLSKTGTTLYDLKLNSKPLFPNTLFNQKSWLKKCVLRTHLTFFCGTLSLPNFALRFALIGNKPNLNLHSCNTLFRLYYRNEGLGFSNLAFRKLLYDLRHSYTIILKTFVKYL